MNLKITITAVLLFFLIGPGLQSQVHAQSLKPNQEKKFVRKGRKAYRKGEYWKAKSYYDKITQANSKNAQYWFEAGLVYYDSQVKREDAIVHFEKPVRKRTPSLKYFITPPKPTILLATSKKRLQPSTYFWTK